MLNKTDNQIINVQTPLSRATSFRFPFQSQASKRELLIGALWMLIPPVGWLLNMGHRIMMVHRMQHGESAWPSWNNYGQLFRHGFLTFLGMVEYHLPSVVCGFFAQKYEIWPLYLLSILLWILATVAVPGYMSHYCRNFDSREIFDPLRAMRRVWEGGAQYWKAWGIALQAMLLSFLGLALLGIGFLYSSVWFWQVAGFSFGTVFSQKFGLAESDISSGNDAAISSETKE